MIRLRFVAVLAALVTLAVPVAKKINRYLEATGIPVAGAVPTDAQIAGLCLVAIGRLRRPWRRVALAVNPIPVAKGVS